MRTDHCHLAGRHNMMRLMTVSWYDLCRPSKADIMHCIAFPTDVYHRLQASSLWIHGMQEAHVQSGCIRLMIRNGCRQYPGASILCSTSRTFGRTSLNLRLSHNRLVYLVNQNTVVSPSSYRNKRLRKATNPGRHTRKKRSAYMVQAYDKATRRPCNRISPEPLSCTMDSRYSELQWTISSIMSLRRWEVQKSTRETTRLEKSAARCSIGKRRP